MKKNVIQTLISLTVIIGICSCTTSPKKTTQKEEATGKWVKYENNPVLGGGDLGTVFDICVLKDSDSYKMYSSWRPQKVLHCPQVKMEKLECAANSFATC